jgi:hypothetical protein
MLRPLSPPRAESESAGGRPGRPFNSRLRAGLHPPVQPPTCRMDAGDRPVAGRRYPPFVGASTCPRPGAADSPSGGRATGAGTSWGYAHHDHRVRRGRRGRSPLAATAPTPGAELVTEHRRWVRRLRGRGPGGRPRAASARLARVRIAGCTPCTPCPPQPCPPCLSCGTRLLAPAPLGGRLVQPGGGGPHPPEVRSARDTSANIAVARSCRRKWSEHRRLARRDDRGGGHDGLSCTPDGPVDRSGRRRDGVDTARGRPAGGPPRRCVRHRSTRSADRPGRCRGARPRACGRHLAERRTEYRV